MEKTEKINFTNFTQRETHRDTDRQRQRERVKQTDRHGEGTGSLHTLINKVQGEDSRGPGERETEATTRACGQLAASWRKATSGSVQPNLPKSVRVHLQSAAECLLYSHNGRCVRELFPDGCCERPSPCQQHLPYASL